MNADGRPSPLTATWVAELTGLGPFFAVETHAGARAEPPWRPMAELVGDGAALTDRVRSVRAALAAASGQAPDGVELRVAASVTQLGLAARLISPVLGAAVTSSAVPRLDLEDMWWQPALGGAFPLSIPLQPAPDKPTGVPGPSSGDLAALIGRTLLDGPIAALVTAVRNAFPISLQVLWGNVASAVNGAATMITTQRPELAPRANALAARLLSRPPLSATRAGVGPRFRRRSCCLIYRISPTGRDALCADCVLGGVSPTVVTG
ncbi:MAG: hypothetical protein QOK11_1628 [Pseudonocardiales bacterium]|nr:hypothetical protein [Pseudonocardiales bacterium]